MRRVDRKMDNKFGLDLIDRSDYGVISLRDGEKIYSLPLSLVRIEDCLYFHSAKEGRKVDLFKNRLPVNLVFVNDIRIPENYSQEELDIFKKDTDKAKKLISNIFTSEFASCLVSGRISLVESKKKKIQVMKKICQKYTPDKMKYFNLAIEAGLDRINVYSISIDQISSKRKKYDQEGLEMKFGRIK